jgi:hypothetical protein
MLTFGAIFEVLGHEHTLERLDNILKEYKKACYATGKRVDQPHLREKARNAIQGLSPFYSVSDAEKLLKRALGRPSLGPKRPSLP